MAMTGTGLQALRKQYVDAVAASQTSDAAACIAYGDAVLLADSRAIVDYIQGNARAIGSDSHGDSHELEIQ
ncbi:MAG: hypothetical protein A2079_06310 [Geobacteraceae bacterium GWC2_48_7]|nr:MAG: hypothetical protein A2079_06310 [Geobacteraceae bacterium GWC2_48_7]